MANYDRVNHAYDQAAAYDANLIPSNRTFRQGAVTRQVTWERVDTGTTGISKAKLAKFNTGFEAT